MLVSEMVNNQMTIRDREMSLVRIVTNYSTGTMIEKVIDGEFSIYADPNKFILIKNCSSAFSREYESCGVIPCDSDNSLYLVIGEYHPGMVLKSLIPTV